MKNRKRKWNLIIQMVLMLSLIGCLALTSPVAVRASYRTRTYRLVQVNRHTRKYYLKRIHHEECSLRYLIQQLQMFYRKGQRRNYDHQRTKFQRVKRNYLSDRYHRRYQGITHMDQYHYDQAIHMLVKHYSHTARQARNETFWDINRDRYRHHLPGLTVSYNAQFIASSRAPRVNYVYNVKHEQSNVDVHDIRGGVAKVNREAEKYHLAQPARYGENCAQISEGDYCYLNLGYKNYYYDTHSGKGMADALNEVYMDYDQSHGNGHRNNILNPYFRHVGIAVAYHHRSNHGCIVEDFD